MSFPVASKIVVLKPGIQVQDSDHGSGFGKSANYNEASGRLTLGNQTKLLNHGHTFRMFISLLWDYIYTALLSYQICACFLVMFALTTDLELIDEFPKVSLAKHTHL